MNCESFAAIMISAGWQCQYFVSRLWFDSGIKIRVFHHLVNKRLVFFPRLIADFIYIAANYCIFIGEYLIAVDSAFGIDRKVLVLFLEAFILVFLQTAEHTAIVHVVSVNDVIKVGKIRLIQSFQKDTSGDMLIAMDIFAQIFFVVPGVHDRIVDANLILIVESYPADDVRVFCF